ncbi:MAG TPA: PfkB family carbohydrate kinase, partial [Candidatus Methylomirabilis sp.]|nr:PfkB family carbohydrate kinase [Candidatus Methylomirabilis sp.]
ILERAEQIGARVAWNPGNAELEKGLPRLTPLIRRVDALIVNREEAALLAHKPVRHLRSIVDKLGDLPKIALLCSDGPRGAYLASRGCTWFCPPLPGKRVNTTGAGDALGSGFVAGFMKTCDLATGLKVGMTNALGVITHMGAKVGILQRWPSDRELAKVRVRAIKLRD